MVFRYPLSEEIEPVSILLALADDPFVVVLLPVSPFGVEGE